MSQYKSSYTGAQIDEGIAKANLANQAVSYSNYSSLITDFNSLDDDVYNVGQNVYVVTLEVPDLWISSVESSSSTYTYTTDDAFIDALETNGYVQVGYYKLSALETEKVDLSGFVLKASASNEADLAYAVQRNTGEQITEKILSYPLSDAIARYDNNGFLRVVADQSSQTDERIATSKKYVDDNTIKSISTNNTPLTKDENGNVNIPIASSSNLGLVKDFGANYGISIVGSSGRMYLNAPTDAQITARNQQFAITANKLDTAVKAAMTDGVGANWTDAEKVAARARMGVIEHDTKEGSANPTTATVADYVGQLYYNTSKKYWFMCTAITTENNTTTYTWKRIFLENLSSGIVIGSPREEQEGTINIGEGKTPSSGTGGRWATCIGFANSCRSNYGLALGGSVGANAQGAIQLGAGTNDTPSTFNVGFQGGSNYQMLDANGKIPNDRLITWRKIYDETLDGTEGEAIDITQDLDGNSFEVKQIRLTLYIPADAGNTNAGYIRFRGDAEQSFGSLYGSTNYGSTSQNCVNIYEAVCFDGQPLIMEFAENLAQATANRGNVMRSISNAVNYYTYFNGIQIYRNSGKFPAGTRIVCYAIDK